MKIAENAKFNLIHLGECAFENRYVDKVYCRVSRRILVTIASEVGLCHRAGIREWYRFAWGT